MTKDDLIPLEEKIENLTKKVNDVGQRIDRHIEITQVHQGYFIEQINRNQKTLYGTNGSPGLDKRVDRIETTTKVISKVSWSGLMAGLGAIGSFFLGAFKSD